MKARIYFFIGEWDDSIVLEGDNYDELAQRCKEELTKRGATYSGSEILEK